MYWQDDSNEPAKRVSDDVVDLVFGLKCKNLPVNHLFALSEAVLEELPWLRDESTAGLHSVNVAASGNGWMRPDDPQALLYLSRRTHFELRVPKHRIDDARQLEGKTLDVCGYAFTLEKASERPLSQLTTLFARFLAADEDIVDEEKMLQWVSAELGKLSIAPKKMLCGKEHFIEIEKEKIRTRSLMVADLEIEESLMLQQHGLGPYRHMGCGLFIPHKGIDDIRKEKE
jgi:CRISPR-associated protein Cas6